MSGTPRWAAALLRRLAPDGHASDVLGDLHEAHARRRQRHGRLAAAGLTTIETCEMAAALVRARVAAARGGTVQDYRLGLRMLVKHPGLTIAGGLALAIAIGVGAGWYDLSRDLFRPVIPLPDGHRLVEIELRNTLAGGDERRVAHDFLTWRRDLRTVEDVTAYRTLERNVIVGGAAPRPVTVAEITASGFALVRVPPLLGRPLLPPDERPGAPPVVVIGYGIWQTQFGGRDVVGEQIQIGRDLATIVGVMPDGFAFPINHRVWMPLRLDPSGYQPLEGPPVRVVARIAPEATQADANVEAATVVARTAVLSPGTHGHLTPRVLAFGGESPGDRPLVETLVRHLPILLILAIACVNVGTLIYARTATRGAEIAVRYALGASRRRIVLQLFVEALVLAAFSAVLGLAGAHAALKWGLTVTQAGVEGGLPFWINPGLKPGTVLFGAALTVLAGALLSLLPALKITGRQVQAQLKNLGTGGTTLRFGGVWTTAMIAQVALTVICIPPAIGIAEEAVRDRLIRMPFPDEQYLAVTVELDGAEPGSDEAAARAFERRREQVYGEFARQVAAEPGVRRVTFGDRLPGMAPGLGRAEVERTEGAAPVAIPTIWTAAIGPAYFESFGVPLVAGRGFHDGDRGADARTVLVNEAFARRYLDGANPVGRRVRYASPDAERPAPWLDIVGMVRDVGMTPTDLGEAPYVFHPASAARTAPLVFGIHAAGDPAALAPRVRQLAARIDAGLRLDDVRPLDEFTWRQETPMLIMAAVIWFVVSLGLFLSAAGIFSLMSVSVSRRTREIGLRTALGASRRRLLAGIFSRALVLVGSGIAAGNAVLLLFVWLSEEIMLSAVWTGLGTTSAVLLAVGLLACASPARRALRIQPMDALREA